MKKILPLIVALVFCSFPGVCAEAAGGVRIIGDEVAAPYIGLAENSAGRSYSRITQALGWIPAETITILITTTEEEFARLTRGALPDWSAAAALPGNRIVVSPLAGAKMNLERILAHEITHCIIDDAAGRYPVPRWFHEGAAEYFSGGWGILDMTYLTWHTVTGGLMDFEDIQNVFHGGRRDAGLAYDLSRLAVAQLVNRFGDGALRAIVHGMADGKDFDDAFLAAVGLSPARFEGEFLVYVRDTFGLSVFFTMLPGTWGAILALAVFAWIATRWRTRRILRRWEHDDHPGNVLPFPSEPPDDL